MGYTKLFTEIIMSTVWREPDHVRLLWITMLALKDRWHIVNASVPGLADSARITLEECKNAIQVLSSPDPYSRTKDFEGRRIAPCDGGWEILNGEKYRNKMSVDERREYNRIKQQEYRDRKKNNVKSCVQNSTQCTHTEAEADTKAKKSKKDSQKNNFSDADLETSVFIFKKIQELNPNHKEPNLKTWANEIRLMRERDNRTDQQIRELFIWANADGFWKSNVLSPGTLRKQWDKLTIQRDTRGDQTNAPNQQNSGSRSKQVSDKVREIGQRDIEQNGLTETLG